jgi:hypothetical protein
MREVRSREARILQAVDDRIKVAADRLHNGRYRCKKSGAV